jgi:hypothetical protein
VLVKALRYNRLTICILLTLTGLSALMAEEQPRQPGEMEYRLKAVCLYNILKFTTWPGQAPAPAEQKKNADADGTAEPDKGSIVIGILGQNQFGEAFAPLRQKTARDKKLVVRELGGFYRPRDADEKASSVIDANSLKACQVLFVCSSEKAHTERILACLGSTPVLTIGENEGFLEAGGMVNFVVVGNRVQFEINGRALENAGLVMEPEVFRLARRVIGRKQGP